MEVVGWVQVLLGKKLENSPMVVYHVYFVCTYTLLTLLVIMIRVLCPCQ